MDTVPIALLVALTQRIPGITLANALGLVEDFARFSTPLPAFDVTTHEGRVALARSLPKVMECLPDRKIQAVRELRTELSKRTTNQDHYGLLASKNAVDAICPRRV